jgi:hypothetical protein
LRFYEENEEFGGISDLSTFILDFFAAFFAAFFAVFFAIFDILVCLAIRCVPQSKSPSLSDVASPMSRGDEIKLDPNTLSLINAACAQVQSGKWAVAILTGRGEIVPATILNVRGSTIRISSPTRIYS